MRITNAIGLRRCLRLTLANLFSPTLLQTAPSRYYRVTPPAPPWYDALDESARWDAQAHFWEAIAEQCKTSPAVFCYDLMNEPVVPGG